MRTIRYQAKGGLCGIYPYLEGLRAILGSVGPVYWRQYRSGTDYQERTGEIIVSALRHVNPPPTTRFVITIDGLTEAQRVVIAKVFRKRNLERRELRGGRDESVAFLRLADALAGFLRHVQEGRAYAVVLWPIMESFFHEI